METWPCKTDSQRNHSSSECWWDTSHIHCYHSWSSHAALVLSCRTPPNRYYNLLVCSFLISDWISGRAVYCQTNDHRFWLGVARSDSCSSNRLRLHTQRYQVCLTFLASARTSPSSFIIPSNDLRVVSACSSYAFLPASSRYSSLDWVNSSSNFFMFSLVLLVKLSKSLLNCCLAFATSSNLLFRAQPRSTSSDLSCRWRIHSCQPYSLGFCTNSLL